MVEETAVVPTVVDVDGALASSGWVDDAEEAPPSPDWQAATVATDTTTIARFRFSEAAPLELRSCAGQRIRAFHPSPSMERMGQFGRAHPSHPA
jgi:hypothetical protein